MNSYAKLRPWTEIEYCDCKSVNRLLLVYTLHDNPIHCYECKGVVDPETLLLSTKQVDEIASWHGNFSALYDLWLDSGEYEDYAKENLLDKDGQVNIKGMAVAKNISKEYLTFYWWFQDSEDPHLKRCPNCDERLDGDNKHGYGGKCNECNIVV
jgi:predicted  nucleic acid-binding Zn ribbon protein